ncbi:MAG TPA: hypothetical protein VKR24_11435 [Candidatus Limnocylindrales bacterium]|nr:hypothetical protein [Candidatus Limnocylindrales bacterium]
MPFTRLARHVLEEWRALECRLAEVEPRSAEAALIRAEAEVLRHEYQHLTDAAIEHDRPVPPPFPDSEAFMPPEAAPPDELGDGPDISIRRSPV